MSQLSRINDIIHIQIHWPITEQCALASVSGYAPELGILILMGWFELLVGTFPDPDTAISISLKNPCLYGPLLIAVISDDWNLTHLAQSIAGASASSSNRLFNQSQSH